MFVCVVLFHDETLWAELKHLKTSTTYLWTHTMTTNLDRVTRSSPFLPNSPIDAVAVPCKRVQEKGQFEFFCFPLWPSVEILERANFVPRVFAPNVISLYAVYNVLPMSRPMYYPCRDQCIMRTGRVAYVHT